ncbi:MAG: hypothetical protein ABI559_10025 [Chloroflexota bacterium]
MSDTRYQDLLRHFEALGYPNASTLAMHLDSIFDEATKRSAAIELLREAVHEPESLLETIIDLRIGLEHLLGHASEAITHLGALTEFVELEDDD